MDINITITDEQGAAIAQSFRLRSYADGNDLMQQVADLALLYYNRRNLVTGISEADETVIATVLAAYNSIAASPITPPPIRLK